MNIPGHEKHSQQWHTPGKYLDMVREVLGSIDLDPYSNNFANNYVGAKYYYTIENPAPEGWEWTKCSTVYMNPPYTGGLVLQASKRFLDAYNSKRFDRGIILTNNCTEAGFFQILLTQAQAISLPGKRINFDFNGAPTKGGNTRGQTFFYFNREYRHPCPFDTIFSKIGTVLKVREK
jgi:hypothetical protein